MLAKNKSGWSLLEHFEIAEEEIGKYENVTGAFAIVTVDGQYIIGYNKWRQQWEFCGGGIEPGETAREAALRELFEETHQRATDLVFKGISRMQRPNGEFCYQAVFVGTVERLEPFVATDEDEMNDIMLWDLKQDIGYVDACDLKIVEMVCAHGKREVQTMIKKATVSEASLVAKLAIQMWENNTLEGLTADLEEIIANPESAVFLLYDGEKTMGFAQCQLRHDYVEGTDSSPVGYLEGIFVEEAYRNNGYAKELLKYCEAWAKDMGCTEFASDCELENMRKVFAEVGNE